MKKFLYFALPSTVLLLASCSMYHTLDSSRTTWRKLDETDGHYGQPYFLPKAMIHLVVQTVPASSKPKPDASATAITNTNGVTVNVNGKVSTTTETTPETTNDPVAAAFAAQAAKDAINRANTPVTPAPTGTPAITQKPDVATGTPKPKIATATPTPTPKPDFVSEPATYVVTITSEIVEDHDVGALYAYYSPNWFYAEDSKLGVNERNLLATANAESSDRTAQVILNLADTAINVAKFASAPGGVPFASRKDRIEMEPEPGTGRTVLYKKLDIDVRFDPLDKDQVDKVKAYFKDRITINNAYISPFTIEVVEPTKNNSQESGKSPKNKKGLYFREPMPLEIHVVGREKEFRDRVASEVERSSGSKKDLLLAQLKAVHERSGHHDVRNVFSVPNKNRVYAFNVARSGFVQSKKTDLTISSGMLAGYHINKPSEAEGFSLLPLELSKRLAELPNSILTYRKDLTVRQGELNTAKTNTFNADAGLEDAIATRELKRQKALSDAEKEAATAKKAAIDAANLLPKAE